MKRFFPASIAIVLAFVACTPKEQEFKLSATGLPADHNDTYLKVYDMKQNVTDSILVKDGAFEYTAPANDTVVRMLSIANELLFFSYEPGEYTLTGTIDDATGETKLRRGGDANSSFVKIQEVNDKVAECAKIAKADMEQLTAEIGDGEPNEEQMARYNAIQEQYTKDTEAVYRDVLTKGGNQLIDWYAFMMLAQSLSPSEFVEYYDAAEGSLIKNDPDLAKMYTMMKAAAATDVGQQFVDYEIVNTAGETKKLSDFRVEGKYFLLDFFASWCGPCKVSMPVIAEIEKEFADILTSVSIAVWERDTNGEAYAKALQELQVTWPSFHDSKNKSADLYGVAGVPTFILFSPEGEILERGHDIKAIQSKLRELNK